MRYAVIVGLLGVLTWGLAAIAWGEEAPADGANANKADAAAPAANVAAPPPDAPPAAPAKTSDLEKVMDDLKSQLAAAESLLKQYNGELAKPDGRKDPKRVRSLKMGSARAYFRLAVKAQNESARLTDADERRAILDQYEKPGREKAVGLLLELASAARGNKDYSEARRLYSEVLQIDAQNAVALSAVNSMSQELKTRKNASARSAGGGTRAENIKESQKTYRTDYSGSPSHQSYGRTGRSNW